MSIKMPFNYRGERTRYRRPTTPASRTKSRRTAEETRTINASTPFCTHRHIKL
jgi:hypothetical protein